MRSLAQDAFFRVYFDKLILFLLFQVPERGAEGKVGSRKMLDALLRNLLLFLSSR